MCAISKIWKQRAQIEGRMISRPFNKKALEICLGDFKRKVSLVASTKTANSQDVLPFSKIPTIPAIPFLGTTWLYLPLIGKYRIWKMHTASLDKYKQYGPIIFEKLTSEFQMVLIYDPEDVVKLFSCEGRYPDRKPIQCFQKYRGNKKDLYNNGGLLTTSGEEWWKVRSQTQPNMMKPKAIHSYIGVMDEVAKTFTDRMVYLRDKESLEVPNYLNELYKWALESVSLVALDKRLGAIDLVPSPEGEKMVNAVNQIFALLMKLELSTLYLWKKFPSITYWKFEKQMDYFSSKAFEYLNEAKKRLQEAPEDHELTFLELMISTTKDPRDINAMITDMIFAGVDTTSNSIGFVLYHLARNPEVQEKAHLEIKSQLQGRPLTLETLNNVPYLKACVKESMRLTPVTVGTFRTITEDTVMSGYAVPAGTMVSNQQYAIGHLDKYFPEAEKFRPERFLRGQAVHDPYAFLPFGFGPRSCIGRRIAEQEIWILLIRVLERFRVEYHFEDIDLQFRGIGAPDKPLRFQFYDR